ncbi:MAG TPA: protein kinase [Aldersonia sp.]
MADSHETRVGTQFGPYHLRRMVGRGGMGQVYEAYDTVKDRTVALKLLPEDFAEDEVYRERFRRESHAAARLQEPHVIPIHDFGEIDGHLFLDMRLVKGNNLRHLLGKFGPMPPARAVAIVRQIAAALDAAHADELVHRDVKPENIIVTRDDFAYLVDFGLANNATDEQLTTLGTAVGTYAYMAPERFGKGETTSRCDVYSLACVLHECLTGTKPFHADSIGVIIKAHLFEPVPRTSLLRPGIPAGMDAVVQRGMAKDPNDRYATAGDLARAATDALAEPDKDESETILERSQAATLPRFDEPHFPAPAQPSAPPQGYSPSPTPSSPAPNWQGVNTPSPQPFVNTPQPTWQSHPSTPPQPSQPSGPTWSGPNSYAPPPKSGGTKVWIPVVAVLVLIVMGVGGWAIWNANQRTEVPPFTPPTPPAAVTTTTPPTTPAEALPNPTSPPTGGEPSWDSLAENCHDGSMRACDSLYDRTITATLPSAPDYNEYGASCGGRLPGTENYCLDEYPDHP